MEAKQDYIVVLGDKDKLEIFYQKAEDKGIKRLQGFDEEIFFLDGLGNLLLYSSVNKEEELIELAKECEVEIYKTSGKQIDGEFELDDKNLINLIEDRPKVETLFSTEKEYDPSFFKVNLSTEIYSSDNFDMLSDAFRSQLLKAQETISYKFTSLVSEREGMVRDSLFESKAKEVLTEVKETEEYAAYLKLLSEWNQMLEDFKLELEDINKEYDRKLHDLSVRLTEEAVKRAKKEPHEFERIETEISSLSDEQEERISEKSEEQKERIVDLRSRFDNVKNVVEEVMIKRFSEKSNYDYISIKSLEKEIKDVREAFQEQALSESEQSIEIVVEDKAAKEESAPEEIQTDSEEEEAKEESPEIKEEAPVSEKPKEEPKKNSSIFAPTPKNAAFEPTSSKDSDDFTLDKNLFSSEDVSGKDDSEIEETNDDFNEDDIFDSSGKKESVDDNEEVEDDRGSEDDAEEHSLSNTPEAQTVVEREKSVDEPNITVVTSEELSKHGLQEDDDQYRGQVKSSVFAGEKLEEDKPIKKKKAKKAKKKKTKKEADKKKKLSKRQKQIIIGVTTLVFVLTGVGMCSARQNRIAQEKAKQEQIKKAAAAKKAKEEASYALTKKEYKDNLKILTSANFGMSLDKDGNLTGTIYFGSGKKEKIIEYSRKTGELITEDEKGKKVTHSKDWVDTELIAKIKASN